MAVRLALTSFLLPLGVNLTYKRLAGIKRTAHFHSDSCRNL